MVKIYLCWKLTGEEMTGWELTGWEITEWELATMGNNPVGIDWSGLEKEFDRKSVVI